MTITDQSVVLVMDSPSEQGMTAPVHRGGGGSSSSSSSSSFSGQLHTYTGGGGGPAHVLGSIAISSMDHAQERVPLLSPERDR